MVRRSSPGLTRLMLAFRVLNMVEYPEIVVCAPCPGPLMVR